MKVYAILIIVQKMPGRVSRDKKRVPVLAS